jgi:hypothetical protein
MTTHQNLSSRAASRANELHDFFFIYQKNVQKISVIFLNKKNRKFV